MKTALIFEGKHKEESNFYLFPQENIFEINRVAKERTVIYCIKKKTSQLLDTFYFFSNMNRENTVTGWRGA